MLHVSPKLFAFTILFGCVALSSCNGGGSNNSLPPPASPAITVSVSPSSANVLVGQTQQFTATVQNTMNTAVTWEVDQVNGGNGTVGTISTTGLYTGPDPAPKPASVTVTAVSQADNTESASASVSLSYPVPTLSSVSPSYALVNTSDTTITLAGSGFTEASTAAFNGSSLATTFVSGTKLTAVLPAADENTEGHFSLSVANPSPGGGTSSTQQFDIVGASLTVKIIDLPADTPADVTVTGPNNLSLSLTASRFITGPEGTYEVKAAGVVVGPVTYHATKPVQSSTITAGSSDTVTVDYYDIIADTTKVLDQVGSQSLVVSPDGSTLTMSSSSPVAASLAAGDILAIGVTPTTPMGMLRKVVSVSKSGGQIIVTTVQGTLAEAFQRASFAYQQTLTPQSFDVPKALQPGVTLYRGVLPQGLPRLAASTSGASNPCTTSAATFVKMIDVPIVNNPDGEITVNGVIEVCPSLKFNWQIAGSPPQLSSLTATVSLGGYAHVNATGRYQKSFDMKKQILKLETVEPITVIIGGVPIVVFPTLTVFVEGNGDVKVGFSAGVAASATGTVGIQFANGQASPVGGISGTLGRDPLGIDGSFQAKAAAGVTVAAYIDGILCPEFTPDAYLGLNVQTQNPWLTLTAGFEGEAGVDVSIFGVVDLKNFTLPVFEYPEPPKNIFLQLTNPFATSDAAPKLKAVQPSAASLDSPDLTLAVTGSNFVPGAVVSFNGVALPTTFIDPQDLVAHVGSAELAMAGTFPVLVINPDTSGADSSSVNFTVAGNPVPAIASLSPTSATAGSPAFTLTVNGSGFLSTSTVDWNGSSRPTTVVSPTELQAAVAASDVATPGVAQVAVVTPAPGGGASNAATFSIAFPSGQKAGIVQTLSANDSGTQGNATSLNAALSKTGRYVAFHSSATNLVTSTTVYPEIYWHDSCIGASDCTPQTQLASAISGTASEGNGPGADDLTTITADGRFVGFSAGSTNLVSPSTTQTDAYGRDTCSGGPAGCTPTTVLLSLTSSGVEPNSASSPPVFSADGRYVAFVSSGNNLVLEGTAFLPEVYLRDTCRTTTGAVAGCTPTTVLVSVDNSGNEANRGVPVTGSGEAALSISADGRFVAFESYSTNLVPGVTYGNQHVYVRDTCIGASLGCAPSTILASVGSSGIPAASGGAGLVGDVSISANGRFVAFTSSDALVPADTNGASDVYLRDTCQSSSGPVSGCAPSTSLVSITPDGSAAGNGSSGVGDYSLSSTGRFVAFYSYATNLTPGGAPGAPAQAFVRDTCFGASAGCVPTTHLVSVDSTGKFVGNVYGVSISGDGHYVAFTDTEANGQLVLGLTGY